jgi:hypothetical protein
MSFGTPFESASSASVDRTECISPGKRTKVMPFREVFGLIYVDIIISISGAAWGFAAHAWRGHLPRVGPFSLWRFSLIVSIALMSFGWFHLLNPMTGWLRDKSYAVWFLATTIYIAWIIKSEPFLFVFDNMTVCLCFVRLVPCFFAIHHGLRIKAPWTTSGIVLFTITSIAMIVRNASTEYDGAGFFSGWAH